MSPAMLSGRLPEGDANGIAAIVRQLVEEPQRVHVVVALIDTYRITENVDDGTHVPTIRIRRIEAISDPDDRDHLRRLVVREFERRTGQAVLPLDLEADLRALFDGTDDDATEDEAAEGEDPS